MSVVTTAKEAKTDGSDDGRTERRPERRSWCHVRIRPMVRERMRFKRGRLDERFREDRLAVTTPAMMGDGTAAVLVALRLFVMGDVVSDVSRSSEMDERLDAFAKRRDEPVDDQRYDEDTPHGVRV